jgi:hypothetical protein
MFRLEREVEVVVGVTRNVEVEAEAEADELPLRRDMTTDVGSENVVSLSLDTR